MNYLPDHYTEVEVPFFEGKGNHSVNKLEELCEGYKEFSHQALVKQTAMIKRIAELEEALRELHQNTLYQLSPKG